MATAIPDAVFTVAAILFAATGLCLLLWAILWDRSRGRRRCPRCWYAMEGATSLTCPECGRTARSERRLFRTRRRWKWAIVAILLLALAPVASVWPRASRDGWLSLTPTWAIGHLMALGDPFEAEVLRRLGIGPGGTGVVTMTVDQRPILLRRAVCGTIFARPGSENWEQTYGELLRSYQFRFYTVTSGELLDAIDNSPASPALAAAVEEQLALPYRLKVRTRDRWPRGMPVLIEAKVEHWWPHWIMDRVSVNWKSAAGDLQGETDARGFFTIDPPRAGPFELDLSITVTRQEVATEGRPMMAAGHERSSVRFTVVDADEDVLPAVASAELDAALISGLNATHDDILLGIEPPSLTGLGFDDVGFGATAEIMHGDEVVLTYRVRWFGSGYRSGSVGPIISGTPGQGWRAALAQIQAAKGEPGWTVRLRSDEAWALQLIDAKRRWEGEVVVPLTIR